MAGVAGVHNPPQNPLRLPQGIGDFEANNCQISFELKLRSGTGINIPLAVAPASVEQAPTNCPGWPR